MLNNDPGTAASAPPEQSAADGSSTWRLRNWRLRYKMAAVLLVPTLAALGVGGVRVYDGLATASSLNAIVEQVELTQQASAVTHELQRERDYAVTFANAGGGDENLAQQGERVDGAIAQLREFDAEAAEFAPEVRGAYEGAVNRLDSLDALRGTVSGSFTGSQTLVAYNSVIDSILQIDRAVSAAAANTPVMQTVRATESVGRAKEQLAQQRSLLLGAAMRGDFVAGETEEVRDATARYEAAYGEFLNSASPAQQAYYAAEVAGAEVDRSEQLLQEALIADDEDLPLGINAQDWGQQAGVRTDLVRSVEERMIDDLRTEADELASSAQWAAIRDGGIVVGLLVLAFGVAAFIARSMLRPLRTLRYGALEIAQGSLPDAIKQVNESPSAANRVSVPPVPVHTDEEIGQVARSFDAVHQQALRLASEQALLRTNINDLFVNLARRSQTLVQRQLSLIDRLEQDEQDPDQLSSLFELDHLATRMRRNNENLLILGGTELTRRMMKPVPLNEVLGAAVSEVEQYARVAIVDSPDLGIQGRVVNDFVHLVAELLENATVFSNPDTEVSVRTAYRRQELVVEIRDRGVGIDSDEIDEINDRLTRPPDIDVAVSRRMGLFVVGQLARRHDITVQLQNNDDLEGGATATVHLSGEQVVQLTPDGPKPMPDLPRDAVVEERDPLRETGSHNGLAAAFGRGGAAPVEPPTERAPLSALEESGEHLFDNRSGAPEPGFPAAEPAAPAAPYSVTVSAGESSSFGAGDVPQWEDDPETPGDDEVRAEEWPAEEVVPAEAPPGLDGECGTPPGLDGPADLFHSPFEAEKTQQFATGFSGADLLDGGAHNGAHQALDGSADEVGTPAESGIRRQPSASGPPVPASVSADDTGVPAPAAADDESRGASWDMDDAPTQRLPIYEAVLSQWFRESDGGDDPVPAAEPPRPAAEPTAGFADQVPAESFPTEDPQESVPQPDETEEVPRTTAPDPGWGSADVGWRAAEALLSQQSEEEQETTAAGLPKRVPKSKLVPGSAAPKTQSNTRKPTETRTPDAVRGRMANFQQGIRRGRHSKADSAEADESPQIPSRPEEQE
ncbi:nitrate- and nitrite sensing domain-containing protein [Saccharopolyspora sp. HNM0983]|uniref:histidine kinase n=2 Tax=Saccharopolyspora montiporae TaxID=2781240 RepID=A0A929B907_9PSEU|nr:nitrate- and nitrite sensing domain-containing protein [Saccharopolyspora sp. HNM0983]